MHAHCLKVYASSPTSEIKWQNRVLFYTGDSILHLGIPDQQAFMWKLDFMQPKPDDATAYFSHVE